MKDNMNINFLKFLLNTLKFFKILLNTKFSKFPTPWLKETLLATVAQIPNLYKLMYPNLMGF